jgi:dihydrofolate reductase
VGFDEKGFVVTGDETTRHPDLPRHWKIADRGPLLLDCTGPRVFAIGDVRRGSTKRVAGQWRRRAGRALHPRLAHFGPSLGHHDRKGDAMSATVLSMSISLDGFIAGPNVTPENGLGDGGERLHDWFLTGGAVDDDAGVPFDVEALRRSGTVNGQVVDELMSTGAIVAGRGTFEPAGGWGGDHHDGVPIFVVARHAPGIDTSGWPLVTYVDDVAAAMTRAKEAAGDTNVLVRGTGVTRLALAAGVLDELELHVVPVLFGHGRRLFEGLAPGQIELERTRILEGEEGVTHMHYRVLR